MENQDFRPSGLSLVENEILAQECFFREINRKDIPDETVSLQESITADLSIGIRTKSINSYTFRIGIDREKQYQIRMLPKRQHTEIKSIPATCRESTKSKPN